MNKVTDYIDIESLQQGIYELVSTCDMYQVFPQDTLTESIKMLDAELARLRETLLETLTEYHTEEPMDDEDT